MKANIKILVLGRYNIFYIKGIEGLGKFADIDAGILLKSEELENVKNVNRIFPFRINHISHIFKFYTFVYSNRNNYDAFVFYSLHPIFSLLLNLKFVPPKKYYFPYGSDLHVNGVMKWLLKKSLKQIKKTFVEQESQKQFICKEFNVNCDKIHTSLIVFNVDPCFKILEDKKKITQIKYRLENKFVIISPRSIKPFYNHHILLEAIGLLDDNLREKIVVVLIGKSSKIYLEIIENLAILYKIELRYIDKHLSPIEMSELFNIAHVNVNIPDHDQFGNSIMEGCLCGSLPLLNEEIINYKEIMIENINCVYTKPNKADVKDKIEYIYNSYTSLKKEVYFNNLNLFSKYTKEDENSKKLIDSIIGDLFSSN